MSNKLKKRESKVDKQVLKKQRQVNRVNTWLEKNGYGDAKVGLDDNGKISIKALMNDGTIKNVKAENPKDLVAQAYKEAEADPAAKKALNEFVEGNFIARTLFKK